MDLDDFKKKEKNLVSARDDSGYYYVFRSPYIAGLSERLAKDLKTLNKLVIYHIGETQQLFTCTKNKAQNLQLYFHL